MESLRAKLKKTESENTTEIARLRETVATSAARYAASLHVASAEVSTSVDASHSRSIEIKVPTKVHTRGTQTYVVLETNLIADSDDSERIKELEAEVTKLKAQLRGTCEQLKKNEADTAVLEVRTSTAPTL